MCARSTSVLSSALSVTHCSERRHMNRLLALAFVAFLAVVGSACGGSSSSPTAAAPVIPQYGGIWSGTYTVSTCTQTGGVALANLCGPGNFSAGSVLPFTMTLAQISTSIPQGVFSLGSVAFTTQRYTLAAVDPRLRLALKGMKLGGKVRAAKGKVSPVCPVRLRPVTRGR